MTGPYPKHTPGELRVLDEKNYHGAIQALFAYDPHRQITVRDVVELISERFGYENADRSLLTTGEVTQMLREGLADARQHLRPDTIDWYNQRVDYLLACADARVRPSD